MIIEVAGGAGSGKTEIIKSVAKKIVLDYEIAVLNVKPVNIKREFVELGVKLIEIDTGDGCLSYSQFKILEKELSDYDIIFLEHPGSYLCKFLSDGLKLAVISACDGKHVVKKYPYLFQFANFIIITKTDICDEEGIKEYVGNISPCSNIISFKNDGLKELIEWIKKSL